MTTSNKPLTAAEIAAGPLFLPLSLEAVWPRIAATLAERDARIAEQRDTILGLDDQVLGRNARIAELETTNFELGEMLQVCRGCEERHARILELLADNDTLKSRIQGMVEAAHSIGKLK